MTELAWAAGFFDGEGSTYVQTRKPSPSDRGTKVRRSMRIRIAQIQREPLDRFQRAVEGLGTVRGPYVTKNPNGQPCYEYVVEGVKAERVLTLVSPFLCSVKLQQADRVREALQEKAPA